MALSLGHFGDCQLAVLVRLALGGLIQVALDDHRHIFLGLFPVVRDGHGDAVVLIHVGAVRQLDRDIPSLADGNVGILDGTPGLVVLHLDGQSPAVAVGILPADSGAAVTVGLAGGAGDGDLPGLIGGVRTVVGVFIGDGDKHAGNSGFILGQQDDHGIATGVVWQAEPDGFVAAGDIALEAVAALVIGPALVGEDGFAGFAIAHEHAVVVLCILIQQATGNKRPDDLGCNAALT